LFVVFVCKGIQIRKDAPPSELAVAVARHFEGMEIDEEECIDGFLQRLESGSSAVTEFTRDTQFYDGHRINPKRKRSKYAARPGEHVAAKVTRTDENGSWILASVQRFYPETDTYDVQDEDDTSKLIRLPWSHVMRLSTGTEGCFKKGADCMAIFPETTSFYKAKISKAPVWKLEHNEPIVKEIIVRFEDDEDGSGKTPHRRVPSRYVIPVPSEYFADDADDVDLTPPTVRK
jgi:SAGA-associated factor 29